ncbi:co-chaperone DjlA [Candidatus Berkiella aquae]|uniref:Co-chaperone protein DjlA n=1 Tax=Candidatus Berkiella aquae TaxID=295108 RepID=A0A0Q9YJT9_9GAMM|nr:co-chaperone DjlA [Candidatus Berkiella aquae]MCS5710117.1 co-chaperone DjlA [Candidatus Berkiella aquae]
MFIWGKVIGASLGGLMGGPWGCIIGILAGHFFDVGMQREGLVNGDVSLAKKIFFKTTFMIMGYIAKADGRVSEREIEMARNVMAQLHLTPEQKMMAIEYFNMGKANNFDSEAKIDEFLKHCGHHQQLMQLFVEIQLQAAFVDGMGNQAKRAVLERLCEKLHVPPVLLSEIEMRFYAEQRFEQQAHEHQREEQTYRYQPHHSTQSESQLAYEMLGVTAKSTDQEIKKAYRKLMSQHHPDKLVAKGLPEEMIKLATEKVQKIQKAYEYICQLRGIK